MMEHGAAEDLGAAMPHRYVTRAALDAARIEGWPESCCQRR
jgi:hypothetical protein